MDLELLAEEDGCCERWALGIGRSAIIRKVMGGSSHEKKSVVSKYCCGHNIYTALRRRGHVYELVIDSFSEMAPCMFSTFL